NRPTHLAQECVGEQAATHADAAMNPPDGERNAGRLERLVPGKDMLIDAVDERPIEVKQERQTRLMARVIVLGHRLFLGMTGVGRARYPSQPTRSSAKGLRRERGGARCFSTSRQACAKIHLRSDRMFSQPPMKWRRGRGLSTE